MSTQTNIPNIDVLAILTRDRVRKLREGETIPETLDSGFEKYGKLDRDWCWVYVSSGEIKGVLLASPCHGTAFVWRFKVLPECGQVAALKLLKAFKHDLHARGVHGFLTLVDLNTDNGKRLQRVVERCGGKDFGSLNLFSAALPKERG